jgi:Flp pilus assembly protein TadG
MRDLRDEEGTVSVFVAVLAVALVAVAGLAYDGGQIIAATAHARDVAGAAARAGAQQAAPAEVHAGRTGLDPAAAHAAAAGFLDTAGATGTVTVDGPHIRVSVTLTQPMRILPVGDRTITVTATSTAVSDVLTSGS